MLPFFEEGSKYDKYDQKLNWCDTTVNSKGGVQ